MSGVVEDVDDVDDVTKLLITHSTMNIVTSSIGVVDI